MYNCYLPHKIESRPGQAYIWRERKENAEDQDEEILRVCRTPAPKLVHLHGLCPKTDPWKSCSLLDTFDFLCETCSAVLTDHSCNTWANSARDQTLGSITATL